MFQNQLNVESRKPSKRYKKRTLKLSIIYKLSTNIESQAPTWFTALSLSLLNSKDQRNFYKQKANCRKKSSQSFGI
jgi:hypothetical protein